MPRDLAELPKAHLHLHLEGSMRMSTLVELAGRTDTPVPTAHAFRSFADFAALYDVACRVVATQEDLRRIVREVVQDAHADGAIWLEPHFSPFQHTPRLGSPEDLVDVVLDEGRTEAARLGIGFGLILSANRAQPPTRAVELARLAAARAADGVVAFGLANDEANNPAEPFAESFAIARDAGLISAPHAGEHAGPASVTAALDVLGAERLGHGIRAVEDGEVVRQLVDRQVTLDVCPTSNVMLSVVPSLQQHPLPVLLDAGVRATLNADDSLLFGSGLLGEYERARATLELTDDQLAFIATCSIEDSGAPAPLVLRAVEGVKAWLSSAQPATMSTEARGPQVVACLPRGH